MVIDDLDARWPGLLRRPLETETPLLVDPNAKLTCTVAAQGFQSVARQVSKIIEAGRGVEDVEAFEALSFEPLKFADEFAGGKALRPLVPIAEDHSEQSRSIRWTSSVFSPFVVSTIGRADQLP